MTWIEVTKARPCIVCGKPDWCCRRDDEDWITCHRTEDPPVGYEFDHEASDSGAGPSWVFKRVTDNGEMTLTERAKQWQSQLTAALRDQQAAHWGLPPESITAIGVGHDGHGFRYPEVDSAGKVVGISWIDTRDRRRKCPKGQHRGLTLSSGWSEGKGILLIVEGPSDTAACCALGLPAVGRPGAGAGAAMLSKLFHGREIIIIGENDRKDDGDWPGRNGAIAVATKLAEIWSRPVRWALPPEGAKDIRDWFLSHGPDSGEELLVSLDEAAITVEPPGEEVPDEAAKSSAEPFVPFPVDVLPEPLKTFVNTSALALGCDPSYIALPMFAALASAIGNSRRIQLKRSWHEPSIIWSCIIGESGTLKTPAFRLAMRPIRRRQERQLREQDAAMQQYNSAVLRHEVDVAGWKARAKKNDSPGDAPIPPEEPQAARCLMGDATVEALAPILLANPRGVLQSRDELAGWIGGFDRYSGGKGGGDVSNWLSMFNGETVIVDRKTGTRTIYVPRASVSIVGGIQPATLRRVLGAEHRENGLAARLLMAWPPRRPKQWTEEIIASSIESEIDRVFDGLFALDLELDGEGTPQPKAIGLSRRGKAAWIRYYNAHAQEQVELTGDEAAAWSKLEGYAARIALVIHLVRRVAGGDSGLDEVDETSIEAGATLCRWLGREACRVYRMLVESEVDEARRKMVELVERNGGRVTARVLMRSLNRISSSEQAEHELTQLVTAGYGKWEFPAAGPKGGAPSKVFVLVAREEDH